MRLFALSVLIALFVCAWPSHAYANGRFPEAQRLLEQPGDPNRLLLAATYGLLVTDDHGANWSHICELSFALRSLEGDPLLEIMPDGSLLAGMQAGVNRSSDCGCTFTPSLGSATQNVIDLTVDTAGNVLALVQDVSTFPGHLLLFASPDSARTWSQLAALPADIPDGYTVDVAPSDTSRLYVSAYAPKLSSGVLLVSMDRGATWDERPIPGTSTSAAPYIGAVSPTQADTVYVRTRAWDNTADFAAQDSLLVSVDAGSSWTTVLHRQATLLGFALSPDGKAVLAGYGDSVTAGFSTNPDDFGVYLASASDLAFTKIFDGTITCLRWTEDGVYACMVQDGVIVPTPGMTVGFAPNTDFTLANPSPFQSLLDVTKVKGPLGCSAAVCADTWSVGADSAAAVAVCQQLGAPCNVDASLNTLECPPLVTDAGTGGGAGAAEGGADTAGSGGHTSGAAGSPATQPDAGPAAGGHGGGGGGVSAVAGASATSTGGGVGGVLNAPSASSARGCGCGVVGARAARSPLGWLDLPLLWGFILFFRGRAVRAGRRRRRAAEGCAGPRRRT